MIATKWKLALETILLVVGVVIAKAVIHHYNLDVVQLNALFTSIIAGGVFIISMILAGTLGDFKECERIPAEIVASLENIYEEGQRLQARCPGFNLEALRATLLEVVETFQGDLARTTSRTCLQAIGRLGDAFTEMEACGLAPNYVVRLKTEQGNLRKQVLRVYHVQRTNFVPSAYVLVDAIIVLIISLLLFAEIDHLVTALIEIAFISYLFVYMVKLLRTIDTPFRVQEKTMDDVSRFLLKEFAMRLRGETTETMPVD